MKVARLTITKRDRETMVRAARVLIDFAQASAGPLSEAQLQRGRKAVQAFDDALAALADALQKHGDRQ